MIFRTHKSTVYDLFSIHAIKVDKINADSYYKIDRSV